MIPKFSERPTVIAEDEDVAVSKALRKSMKIAISGVFMFFCKKHNILD